MTNFKFFAHCESCKKRRFIIKNRSVVLPIGLVALSKRLLCSKCQKVVQQAITKWN